MRDDDLLLSYYNQELTYLRSLGAEFADRHPKVAGRLQLERSKCEDPHVERLLEAFAFLAARVHLKIDDDFPEVSEALLNVVHPHFVRPIPSMSLVEFELDPERGKLTSGLPVAAGTPLYSPPVGGAPCKFRTCYDTTLWPLTVAGAQWLTPDRLRPAVHAPDAVAALRLELQCFADMRFDMLDLRTLRLHLAGESSVVYVLYELLAGSVASLVVRDPSGRAAPVVLDADALRPVGFAEHEGMLPLSGRSFAGYQLLQEYFAFPAKFLFFDLTGLDRLRDAGFGDRAEIVVLFKRFERAERRTELESGVNARTIRLGCTPIVNLFEQVSEPVRLTERRAEYPLVADLRRRTTEIFSIDEVMAARPGDDEALRIEPFYALRHGAGGAAPQLYWRPMRRTNHRRDGGGRAGRPRDEERTDIFLSFVDLSARVIHPERSTATARLTCFDGELPSQLPPFGGRGDFDLKGGGPFRVNGLVKPTPVLQPPLGKPQLWRLVSQLSLNYLSLVDGSPDALREILRLHNVSGSREGEDQIMGITGVTSAPTHARVVGEHGLSFARGQQVEVRLDEDLFAGAGAYLFASVLERFLGLYVSLNSFVALTAHSSRRERPLGAWAPRAGRRVLL